MTDELLEVPQSAADAGTPVTLDPDDRQRPNLDAFGRQVPPRGVPIESLGKTWVLAWMGVDPEIAGDRDDTFDYATIRDRYLLDSVYNAGWRMLRRNYRLSIEEAELILVGADRKDLAKAVCRSLIPHDLEDADRGYTAWARSALLANGLDPAKIPAADVGAVLYQLLLTGRAAKLAEFIPSTMHAAYVARIEGAA